MTINNDITVTTDAAALSAIHAACFDKGWDEQAIAGMLAIKGTMAFIAIPSPDPSLRRDGEDSPSTLPPLAGGDGGGNAFGFGLLRQVSDEVEILTLAVLPQEQKRGTGSAIVRCMLQRAREQGAKSVFLEVSERNLPALKLYEKNGFSLLSRRKGYYHNADDTFSDALVMRAELT